jgi:hypothetical protein
VSTAWPTFSMAVASSPFSLSEKPFHCAPSSLMSVACSLHRFATRRFTFSMLPWKCWWNLSVNCSLSKNR